MKLIFLFILTLIHFGHCQELNLRNIFSKALKTTQDQHYLTQIEQRLPKFVDLDIPSNENIDKIFSKFKEFIRLIPASIHRETLLNANSAGEIFPALQPIYVYVKESVWKTILKLIDLPKELVRIPAQNLPETNLNNFLKFSDEKTVSKVLELNSNRQDFNDEQKTIIVENYIDKIKTKLNPSNFQQLITQSLGASFLRYVPLDFLVNDQIFNDNSVIRNVATWLHLLKPLQRDAITNKVYRSLTNTTGKSVQNDPNNPLYLTENDPSTLDMLARMMPSLSIRQIIKTIGEKIVSLLERSSIRDDQSCSTALALLNRTIESKKTSNRYFRIDPKLVQNWQTCYSGCDLRNLFTNRQDIKDLLRHHPNPESCEDLVAEVKKEYGLERDIASIKLRETADVFGSIYRSDEINNLSGELMADLGRDEKALEKLGSQDLTPHQARAILNKIPRSTQNLWGKNMLSKLGNLIPGIDNVILRQILTRGRGELPSLFNHTTPSFIRKLIPSKIRLLIDQYATEPNLAKYRQFIASNYAKKYIQSDTLMKILQLAPDVLRLVRFTPAQASAAIANRLGSERNFDGSLSNLGLISNFLNGLTKTDIEKIKAEESLQAVQQAFGSSKTKTIDNQMQSNTRYAFGNLLRRGLQTSENTPNVDEYIKGLFREDNLVEDLNPELFTTMTNDELEAISRLDKDLADRFWNAIGSIREPSCCSIINENRFRLADYALKYYGSTTGELDNFKLSQLGPFLITSLRAVDLRRMTTDALMNKIHVFKTSCFQGDKAEGQALGGKLNDVLGEVDDGLKSLYLDLIGELIVYLPNEFSASKKILAKRVNYLSKSIDKLENRDDQCLIIDTNEYLNQSKANIKRVLANAYLDQRSPSDDVRLRRQVNQNKDSITCRDLRQMGSSISSLSSQQISSISNEVIFECINAFSTIKYASSAFLKQIAEKYIQALQSQGRHIQSLTQNELYELNSILTGFTPSELFQLKNQPFHDGNFLAFIGNLNGWTVEQLQILAQLVLGSDQRLTPTIIENAGQILCVIDEQLLRRIPHDQIKSNLPIFANLDCPVDSNVNYSSIMFDIVRVIYQADTLRPHILGSLGIIAAGLKSTDIPSLSPELINFFPSKALAYLPNDVFHSFTNHQFENFNIEQIQAIPNHLFNTLNSKQSAIINQIRYPFKSTEELNNHIDTISTTEIDDSGANMQTQCSIYILSMLSLFTIFFTR